LTFYVFSNSCWEVTGIPSSLGKVTLAPTSCTIIQEGYGWTKVDLSYGGNPPSNLFLRIPLSNNHVTGWNPVTGGKFEPLLVFSHYETNGEPYISTDLIPCIGCENVTWLTPLPPEPLEKEFCLKAFDDQNFVVSEDDLMTVNANRTACYAWENHTIIDANGSDLESGDYVFIRSYHSRYWSAQPNGELEANRSLPWSWERFQIFKTPGLSGPIINAGDDIRLRSVHNKWLVAENGGGNVVRVNRSIPHTWETFTLIDP
jgi:hypothetical protein